MRLGDLDKAEAVMRNIADHLKEDGRDDLWPSAYAAADVIKSQRTIDAVPVVHGRWVGLEYDGYADGCPVYDVWECSECGEEVSGEDVPETHPYCHGCGARMDGGAADGV